MIITSPTILRAAISMFTVKNLIARFIGLIVITMLYLAIYGTPGIVGS